MKKLQLETDRLFLKTLTPSYASKVLKFYDDNRSFFQPYEPLRPDYFYTRHHQKQLLKWDLQALSQSSTLRLWLLKKSDPTYPIGTLSLSSITRGVFQSCIIGYKLDKQHTSQGFMSEALFRVIMYAFQDMALHRLEANIMPKNTPSLNLVKKFGFQEEGLAKRYLKINGEWEDHIHMVLLNE